MAEQEVRQSILDSQNLSQLRVKVQQGMIHSVENSGPPQYKRLSFDCRVMHASFELAESEGL